MSDSMGFAGGAWLDDATVEALLTGDGPRGDAVTGVLTAVRGAADRPAPEPSQALAAMLANGLPEVSAVRRRRSRIVAGLIVAGGTTFALSGVAAANNALPGPVQRIVTDIYNKVTPIHIDPQPHHRPARVSPSGVPAPTVSVTPASSVTRSPSSSAPSTGHHRAQSGYEPGDDNGGSRTPSRSGTDGGTRSSSGGEGHGHSGSGGSGSGSGKGGSESGGSGSGNSDGGNSDGGSSGAGGSHHGSGSGGSESGGSDSGGSSGSDSGSGGSHGGGSAGSGSGSGGGGGGGGGSGGNGNADGGDSGSGSGHGSEDGGGHGGSGGGGGGDD